MGRKGGTHNRPGQGNVQRLVDGRTGYVSFRGRVRLDGRDHAASAVGAGRPELHSKRQWAIVERRAEQAARANLDALIADLTAGRVPDTARARATLTDYLAVWRKAKRDALTPATDTWRSYRILLDNHVEPFLGGVRLSALGPAVVLRWREELLADGRSVVRVRNAERLLKEALRDAPGHGYTIDAATLTLKPLADPKKGTKPDRPHLSAAQFVKLVGTAEEPWAALWAFLYFTAARIGEARGAKWSAVLWTTRQVRIEEQRDRHGTDRLPKWGSVGTVDVDRQLIDRLTEHRRRQEATMGRPVRPDEPIFAGLLTPGTVPGYERIRQRWHADLEAAGLPAMGLHATRHGAGFLMGAVEPAPLRIKEAMRHGKLETTMLYVKNVPDAGRQTAERVGEAVKQAQDHAATP